MSTARAVLYHPTTGHLFAANVAATPRHILQASYLVDLGGLAAGTRIKTVRGDSTVLPSLDFECYSEAGFSLVAGEVKGLGKTARGLSAVGAAAYAEHPSTRVLCAAYDLKDGKGERLWVPGVTPLPIDLLEHVRAGGLINAHNSLFEWLIWNMVCARQYLFPPLALEQLRCSMAKARAFGLPGSLADGAAVCGTSAKDPVGKTLITKLCVPKKHTKTRKAYQVTRAHDPVNHASLGDYCVKDIKAEAGLSAVLPDLSPFEYRVWLADQKVNARGVQVDVPALDDAIEVLRQATDKYTAELVHITQGELKSPSEVAATLRWLAARDVELEDLKDETVTSALERLGEPINSFEVATRRVLQIRAALGSANVKKLATIKRQVNSDGRLRGQYSYCGAERTGRWSAGGVQLQNITARGPKFLVCEDMTCNKPFGDHKGLPVVNGERVCPRCRSPFWSKGKDWGVAQASQGIEDLKMRDLSTLEAIWGDAVELLCGCLRGLFIARPGYKLVCCDYSAIEAVVAACLARCMWRVEVFSTPGECIYTQSASKITGTPIEVYKKYKAENKVDHPDRKKIGKVAELASGYSGWINAWLNFGADMPREEIKKAILKWRDESPEIVEMWGGQARKVNGAWVPELYGLEGMFIKAVLNPGLRCPHNDITYYYQDGTVFCELPSGRTLSYHDPKLFQEVDEYRGPKYRITFMGHNSNREKGNVGWERIDTYGGKLFENVVQATARDLQAKGLAEAEEAGYSVVMHTHDELTAEVPDTPFYSLDGLKAIMVDRPKWAEWWPIKGAGWEGHRYRKD